MLFCVANGIAWRLRISEERSAGLTPGPSTASNCLQTGLLFKRVEERSGRLAVISQANLDSLEALGVLKGEGRSEGQGVKSKRFSAIAARKLIATILNAYM